MKRLLNILLLVSLPLALIVVGLVGLLREPSAQFKMKINSGNIAVNFNKIIHNIYGPVHFKNFFLLSIDDNRIARHLGVKNLSYLFPDKNERFKFNSDNNVEGEARLSLNAQNHQFEIRYHFPDKLITDKLNPKTVFAYATSLKPSIHYTRRRGFNTSIKIFLDNGKETELSLSDLKQLDRIILIALPKRNVMGAVSTISIPTVSYKLDPKSSPHPLSYSLIMSATDFSVSNARGTMSIGSARWSFDTVDEVKVHFKKGSIKSSKIDLGGSEGNVLQFPSHLITTQCDSQQCWIKAQGEAEKVLLNNQPLQDSLFGIGIKWFWGALASGLLGAIISLYMEFVKRTSRRREV